MPSPTALSGAGNVTSAGNASGTTLVLAKPANVADGYLMVAVTFFRNTGAASTPPAGWSAGGSDLTNGTTEVWYKYVSSAAAETATSYTWTTVNGSARNCGFIFLVTGALSSPQDVAGVGSVSPTAGSITTNFGNELLLCVASANSTTTTPTNIIPATGMTEIAEASCATATVASTVEVAAESLTAAGATGTRVVTYSAAPGSQRTFLVSIKSAGQTVSPTGVTSGEAVGTPTVTSVATIAPTGIPTGTAFGNPLVTQPKLISPTGIPLYDPVIDVMEDAIAIFGIPKVTTSQILRPTGIPSSAAVGTPSVFRAGVLLVPTGIPSGESVGTPTVTLLQALQPLFRFESPTQSFTTMPFDVDGGRPRGPRMTVVRGLTVLRIDGVWSASLSTSAAEEAAADRLYYGGHVYTVDQQAAAELVAAGFGSQVTPI